MVKEIIIKIGRAISRTFTKKIGQNGQFLLNCMSVFEKRREHIFRSIFNIVLLLERIAYILLESNESHSTSKNASFKIYLTSTLTY